MLHRPYSLWDLVSTEYIHRSKHLVERGQVVLRLDEERLVDSRVVHIVGGSCH